MTFRTSWASWLTLGPTSLAPMRMTMVLGVLRPAVLETLRLGSAWALMLVRFLTRLFGILEWYGPCAAHKRNWEL